MSDIHWKWRAKRKVSGESNKTGKEKSSRIRRQATLFSSLILSKDSKDCLFACFVAKVEFGKNGWMCQFEYIAPNHLKLHGVK